MLEKLVLKSCFTHNNFVFEFKKGLTAITGPNGTGKSLILEMIEFCLWGVAALRTNSEAYKGAQATLDFSIRGKGYRVDRNTSGATLFENFEGKHIQLATGTKGVNAKIIELFGYGYDVYRTTNVAKQGEIERMGNMRPAERKQLVDETIGLARIEALATWVTSEHNSVVARLSALQELVREPAPLPASPPVVTQAQVDELKAQLAVYHAHARYLMAPVEVLPHRLSDSLQALRIQQQKRVEAQAQVRALDAAIGAILPPGERPADHPRHAERATLADETMAWREATNNKKIIEDALRGTPQDSKYTDQQLDEAQATIQLWKRWKIKQSLLRALVQLQCPKCDHKWHTEDPRLQDYADVPETEPNVDLVQSDIDRERKVNAYQGSRKTFLDALTKLTEKLETIKDNSKLVAEIADVIREQEKYDARLKNQDHKKNLTVQRDAIVIPDDVSALLDEVTKQQYLYSQYQLEMNSHREALLMTKDIPTNIQELVRVIEEARTTYTYWEYQQRTYATEFAKFQEQTKQVEMLSAELQDWKNVRGAIVLLRSRIKGYLLPSLNDVASRLVNRMSKGWLKWITVNEDFDIFVGEKHIKALSGAGKAIANLALRIGLGQVLTNSVFPVLMLDEADAGVDQEKAPMIAEALRALTGVIHQIIVITHKPGIEADHRLELTNV